MILPRRIFTDATRTKLLEEGEVGCDMLVGGAGQKFNTLRWPNLDVQGYFAKYPTLASKTDPSANHTDNEDDVNDTANAEAPAEAQAKAQQAADNKSVEAPPQTKAMLPKANKRA